MRTIIWYIHFVITLILKSLELSKINKLKKTMPKLEWDVYVEETTQRWGRAQVKMSGSTIFIEGQENIPKDGAVLFVSNHQSNFDIAIFLGYIRKPKGYIAKDNLINVPVLRTWMKVLGCVFMDREDIRKSAKSILEGIGILKSGHSLVIFPEGTRSKSDKIGTFKAGAFKLATKSSVPIVPVTISGSYKIMEANKSKIKPAEVYVTIHPPVYTENLSLEDLKQIPQKVQQVIESGLPQ